MACCNCCEKRKAYHVLEGVGSLQRRFVTFLRQSVKSIHSVRTVWRYCNSYSGCRTLLMIIPESPWGILPTISMCLKAQSSMWCVRIFGTIYTSWGKGSSCRHTHKNNGCKTITKQVEISRNRIWFNPGCNFFVWRKTSDEKITTRIEKSIVEMRDGYI